MLACALGTALVAPAIGVPTAAAATTVKAQYKNNDSAPTDNQVKRGCRS